MTPNKLAAILACVVVSFVLEQRTEAAEICGNGIDDDSPPNGLVDEGCYPQLTTNQCLSPLNCE